MSSDRTIHGGLSKPPFVPLEPTSTLLGLGPAAIMSRAKELAHFVREYSRQQKATWQKIPWLALQAYDRDTDFFIGAKAFAEGFWEFSFKSRFNDVSIKVDLATGELLDAWGPASDDSLVLLALHMDELNAAEIEEFCHRWMRTFELEKEKNARWKAEREAFVKRLAERYNVSEIYTRSPKTP